MLFMVHRSESDSEDIICGVDSAVLIKLKLLLKFYSYYVVIVIILGVNRTLHYICILDFKCAATFRPVDGNG